MPDQIELFQELTGCVTDCIEFMVDYANDYLSQIQGAIGEPVSGTCESIGPVP
jgi:hypothetical protein